MGINLVTEVLDHAPPGLCAGDRLMLVILAESARDETRQCWPGSDVLAHRTGTDRRSVRRTLTRLEGRGLIARVPVGVDAAGRAIYAHRGHATVYRIEQLRGGDLVALPVPPAPDEPTDEQVDDGTERRTHVSPIDPGKEDATVRHLHGKGGPLGPERGTAGSGMEDRTVPPPLIEPSGNPHPRGRSRDERAAVIRALHERTGKTIDDDQADRVVRQLLDGRPDIRHRAAYLRGAIERDRDPHRFLPTPMPPRYRREDAAHA